MEFNVRTKCKTQALSVKDFFAQLIPNMSKDQEDKKWTRLKENDSIPSQYDWILLYLIVILDAISFAKGDRGLVNFDGNNKFIVSMNF